MSEMPKSFSVTLAELCEIEDKLRGLVQAGILTWPEFWYALRTKPIDELVTMVSEVDLKKQYN